MPSFGYSESELIEAIKHNNKEGFDYLYQNYNCALYGVIMVIVKNQDDANDILQEVFVKIWKNINQYDPELGRLFTWMSRIARNSCLDYLKNSYCLKRNKFLNCTIGEENSTSAFEVSINGIGILKMVSNLQSKYSTLIQLAFVYGLTHEEISIRSNLPLGTVKSRIRKALQVIRADFAYINLSIV